MVFEAQLVLERSLTKLALNVFARRVNRLQVTPDLSLDREGLVAQVADELVADRYEIV